MAWCYSNLIINGKDSCKEQESPKEPVDSGTKYIKNKNCEEKTDGKKTND